MIRLKVALVLNYEFFFKSINSVACCLLEPSESYNSPKPLQFLSNLNLEVHAVRCGRVHTLLLTNNGVSRHRLVGNRNGMIDR